MRMNAGIRKEILNRVMKDVPVVDNKSEVRKKLVAACGDVLPKKVAVVWKDPELRGYIKADYYDRLVSEYVIHDGGKSSKSFCVGLPVRLNKIDKDVLNECRALMADEYQSDSIRAHTRRTIEAALASVTTLKKFKDLFPELAKYAPEEDQKLENLPLVTDVVSSLRDAGWKAA